jgi:hypothetical protein
MQTIKITKADLDKDNFYKEDGIGNWDNSVEASVKIEEGLGYVRFKKGIYITASLIAEVGSGIKAGEGIEAGSGIKAGWGIISLYSWIKAKLSITVDSRCTISAGIFSYCGAQDVEAAEINGNVIYGNVKIIPAEKVEKKIIKIKTKTGEVVEGEII